MHIITISLKPFPGMQLSVSIMNYVYEVRYCCKCCNTVRLGLFRQTMCLNASDVRFKFNTIDSALLPHEYCRVFVNFKFCGRLCHICQLLC